MTNLPNDISKIWNRLFDHRSFLSGEIDLILKEFEQTHGDQEVDNLFKTIEDIANIRDTGLNSLKETDSKLIQANQELSEALRVAGNCSDLGEKYNKNPLIEEERKHRKILWNNFMDSVTSEYAKINLKFEEKEVETRNHYEKLTNKLSN